MVKGKNHSEETKKKLSLAHIGKKHSEEHKLKLSQANKGKHHSEETKRKISISRLGKGLGKIGYWKGKTHSEEQKRKISLANKGRKFSEESRQKMSEARRGEKRHPLTNEHKKKISDANRGKTHSEETKQKIREWHIQHPTLNRKFSNTSIELIMKDLLDRLHIGYLSQHPLEKTARVDFYIPKGKLVIQCDGCYWHGCPIHCPESPYRINNDSVQDAKLTSLGYTILRFWEHDIIGMKTLSW